METKYKYFIEDIDTNEWYWLNLDLEIKRKCHCGKCPYCYYQNEPKHGWTKNPLQALGFLTKEYAEI
jgi:hypothetical protein